MATSVASVSTTCARPCVYQSTEKVTLLRSTSAPVLDTWSVPSQPYNAIGGARQMTSGQRELFKLITPGAL
ncbi:MULTISPECIES: polymorphic toxin type 46 domain-containing protein [Pseudomonas]|uniref:polymorphic toxin type 46 domain-containing protein n=1 Tax=Pseudomonas TaxID=286 RepID=UPI001FA96C64|nr:MULTISPECIES: polymorphic toxin type 46 domain-containing protein [Pseudomonas]